jgi:integrase
MIYVKKSVLGTKKQSPKTVAAVRDIDVCSPLAHFIKEFIGDRTSGFLFNSDGDKPLLQGNILRDSLHKIEKGYTLSNSKGKLIIEVAGVTGKSIGFHAFRRFRETHLELEGVPQNLIDMQIGHKSGTMSGTYFKPEFMDKRRQIIESAGLGFELPTSKVVEMKQPMEVAA